MKMEDMTLYFTTSKPHEIHYRGVTVNYPHDVTAETLDDVREILAMVQRGLRKPEPKPAEPEYLPPVPGQKWWKYRKTGVVCVTDGVEYASFEDAHWDGPHREDTEAWEKCGWTPLPGRPRDVPECDKLIEWWNLGGILYALRGDFAIFQCGGAGRFDRADTTASEIREDGTRIARPYWAKSDPFAEVKP